jgi:hypothetical protein
MTDAGVPLLAKDEPWGDSEPPVIFTRREARLGPSAGRAGSATGTRPRLPEQSRDLPAKMSSVDSEKRPGPGRIRVAKTR